MPIEDDRQENGPPQKAAATTSREARSYLAGKISGWAGLASEGLAATVMVASSFRVVGGRQISVLQAW
jgi:hypothetical protein